MTTEATYTTDRGLHAVRYRSSWILVQHDRDGYQYRTRNWFAPANASGLVYVLSGGGNARYHSIKALIEGEAIDGRPGDRHDLDGIRAYRIEVVA